jgi:hypothetical protein
MLTTIAMLLVSIVCGYFILIEVRHQTGKLLGYVAEKVSQSMVVQNARQRAASAIKPEERKPLPKTASPGNGVRPRA